LRRHALPGTALDVGCNDGTLTSTLLAEGRLTKAQGIDLEILHDHFPVLSEIFLICQRLLWALATMSFT
jgi:hypothetical protein